MFYTLPTCDIISKFNRNDVENKTCNEKNCTKTNLLYIICIIN